ncbi:hypothetical protein WJX79_005512 [Trebouxia sp. C0005]
MAGCQVRIKLKAGDGDEVSFIRTQLEQLYKKEVALREKENLLLRAQQGGQAARPDKPASSFAEFLQSQAGKQQIAAGAGSLVVRQLETAVNMLPSGALQDTVQQILTVGYHNGSDSLFHMSYWLVVQDLAGKFVADSMDVYAQPKYNNFPTFDSLNCGCLWFQVTVAKKHSDFMGGFKALQAAALPTCNLNNFVHPTLRDNSKPIHMIVTTPDRFETCYLKQKQSKGSLFQRGVMKLDLSSAFGQLQHKLGLEAP